MIFVDHNNVKCFTMESNTFKMHMVDLGQICTEKRCLGQIYYTIQRGLYKNHLLVGSPLEPQIPIRNVKFDPIPVLFAHGLHLATKVLERLVEPFPQLTLPLLVVHLVRVVHGPPLVADLQRGVDDLRVELNVLLFFFEDHDRIFEVEVDEDHDFLFAGLEDGVFDVVVHDVQHRIAARRDEPKAVAMSFEVSLHLSSLQDGTHRQVGETGDAFVFSADERFLFDEVSFLLFFLFTLTHSFSQFRDLTKGLIFENGRWKD
mmetsp:Transcript_35652/g.82915  ORF Transcript_35652/g.82915 Transcript_35652/m.82915 type:complete len:260 (-) Transcript_35652:253-1032(-)